MENLSIKTLITTERDYYKRVEVNLFQIVQDFKTFIKFDHSCLMFTLMKKICF